MTVDFKEINLEDGMPSARQAVGRLLRELENGTRGRTRVIKLIHGYGSSGKGGTLRVEVRRKLAALQRQGRVKTIILGEKYSIFEEDTRKVLELAPVLRGDHDLDRYNNGITIFVT